MHRQRQWWQGGLWHVLQLEGARSRFILQPQRFVPWSTFEVLLCSLCYPASYVYPRQWRLDLSALEPLVGLAGVGWSCRCCGDGFCLAVAIAVRAVVSSLERSPLQLSSFAGLGARLRSRCRIRLGAGLGTRLGAKLGARFGTRCHARLCSRCHAQLGTQCHARLCTQCYARLCTRCHAQLCTQCHARLCTRCYARLCTRCRIQHGAGLGTRFGAGHEPNSRPSHQRCNAIARCCSSRYSLSVLELFVGMCC
jgi:hypothetical protein